MNKFNKTIGTLDVVVLAFGAMIGWGWLIYSGSWIKNAGVAGTAIAFLLGGLMIYFIGQTYAELSTAIPEGGIQKFALSAFGEKISFIAAWFMLLSYIGVVCFEVCSFPTILEYIFPGFTQGYMYTVAGYDVYLSSVLASVTAVILITGINFIGINFAAKVQTLFTGIIAFVGIILFLASLFTGSVDNFSLNIFQGNSIGENIENIAAVAIVTPFFLFGFDVIPQAAEEINVPLKKMGKLLLLSIAMAVVFYIMIVFSIGLDLSSEEIRLHGEGLTSAFAMEKAFNSSVMSKLMIGAGMCGIFASWNSFLIGGSRVLYALGKDKLIPGMFSYLHKDYGTPVIAILTVGIISLLVPFFGKSMLVWIVNAASFATCLAYNIAALAFLKLRIQKPGMSRPYKVGNFKLVGISAAVLSFSMMAIFLYPKTGFGLEEYLIIGIWMLLGMGFYVRSKYFDGNLSKNI